jgi:hypothetical protein
MSIDLPTKELNKTRMGLVKSQATNVQNSSKKRKKNTSPEFQISPSHDKYEL